MSHNTTVEEPPEIARLPKDKIGRPIPWFVNREVDDADGQPDFRVASADRRRLAMRDGLCWVCGGFLDRVYAFVIGPMCTVNRVTSEPPSHTRCAAYSARVCPFLVRPNMRRRETGLPENLNPIPGEMIPRNPGVTALWHTYSWEPLKTSTGILLRIGPAARVHWYAQGHQATREEVLASIDSGYPLLLEAAQKGGPRELAMLDAEMAEAMKLVPRR